MSEAVFGFQAVRSVLRDSPERARCLYIQKGRRDARAQEVIGMARELGVRFQTQEGAFFRRKFGDENHQGVALEIRAMELASEADLLAHLAAIDNPLVLILDEITDPRNLGACLRSANGAGVDAVVLPSRNSAPISELVLRTAQGGAEQLFIAEVTNLSRTLKALKAQGIWLTGADGAAEVEHTSVDLTGPCGIVLGSEGRGLRRLTREHCDHLAAIPMLGSVSSLNVSVACGVLLYEALRQRRN